MRLRLGISNMLLLMAVIAILLAWAADRQRMRRKYELMMNYRPGWSAAQATGPPDTSGSGDIQTAWASKTPDGRKEWLIATFVQPVVPSAIEIHETYNPGAVYRVAGIDSVGLETTLWQGVDPTPVTSSRGISVVPVNTSTSFRRIKVYIDSPAVPGWNEIDAIGVRSKGLPTLWAIRVRASSSYR